MHRARVSIRKTASPFPLDSPVAMKLEAMIAKKVRGALQM
jgi:hypothetical protein